MDGVSGGYQAELKELGVYEDTTECDDLTDNDDASASRGRESKVPPMSPVLEDSSQISSILDYDDDDGVITEVEADIDGEGVVTDVEEDVTPAAAEVVTPAGQDTSHDAKDPGYEGTISRMSSCGADGNGDHEDINAADCHDNGNNNAPAHELTDRGSRTDGVDDPDSLDGNDIGSAASQLDGAADHPDDVPLSPRDSARGASPDSTLTRSTLDGVLSDDEALPPPHTADSSRAKMTLSELETAQSLPHPDQEEESERDRASSVSSSRARERVFKRALDLLHKRCVSVATTVAAERQRPGSGAEGETKEASPFYETRASPMMVPGKHVKYVYMEQRKPVPLDPVKAWKGYNGNIYFEPLRIDRAPRVCDAGTIATSAPSLDKCSPILQDILRKRETLPTPASFDEAGRANPALRYRAGLYSRGGADSSDPQMLEHRQMSLLDREAVMSRFNPRLSEDVVWLRGQENVGSLTVEAGSGDRARTAHKFRSSKLCRGSVAHQLKLMALTIATGKARARQVGGGGRALDVSGDPGAHFRGPATAQRSGALRTTSVAVATGSSAAAVPVSPFLRSTTQYSMSQQHRGPLRAGGSHPVVTTVMTPGGSGSAPATPASHLKSALKPHPSSVPLGRASLVTANRPVPPYVKLDRKVM